jgi:hypothetical protein
MLISHSGLHLNVVSDDPHSYVNDVTEQVEPMSEKDRCSNHIMATIDYT